MSRSDTYGFKVKQPTDEMVSQASADARKRAQGDQDWAAQIKKEIASRQQPKERGE